MIVNKKQFLELKGRQPIQQGHVLAPDGVKVYKNRKPFLFNLVIYLFKAKPSFLLN